MTLMSLVLQRFGTYMYSLGPKSYKIHVQLLSWSILNEDNMWYM